MPDPTPPAAGEDDFRSGILLLAAGLAGAAVLGITAPHRPADERP